MRTALLLAVTAALASCSGSRQRAEDAPAPAPAVAAPAAPAETFDGVLAARMGGESHAAGTDDIDGDGVDDCWDASYDGGSGFGGIRFAFQLGCAGAPLVVDTYGSFGELLGAPALPSDLAIRPGAVAGVIDWLYGAEQRVCDDATCAGPDGSFAWLLDERAARDRAPLALGPFERVWRYAPRWQPGAPSLPPSQVMAVKAPFALIAYHAHNHTAGGRQLTRAASCADGTLWTTAHGVALEDAATGRWTWVYVSTGVDKLRWPSIERVACAGGLVAIERKGQDFARELIVVAPATGGVGTLPLDSTWSLGDELLLGDEPLALAQLSALFARDAWQSHLDLDGDGAVDRVEVDFSGGAHCCYSLTLVLATGDRFALPFELDGGYIGGLDLSRPEHFAAGDHDGDGHPDLLAVIETYSMDVHELSPELQRLGVRTHRVLVDVPGGRLRIRDWSP